MILKAASAGTDPKGEGAGRDKQAPFSQYQGVYTMSDPRLQVARQRMQAGTYGAQGEAFSYSLYDTAFVDSTTPILSHRLFTNPLGTVIGGVQKTYAHTNVTRAGIPQGHHFSATVIKAFVIGRSIRKYVSSPAFDPEQYLIDLYTMLNDTVLNVEITGKATLGAWPLNEIIGNAMNIVMLPTAEANGKPLVQLQKQLFTGGLKLKIPLVLAALTDYTLSLTHYTAPSARVNADWLKISLFGTLERLG